MNYGMPLVYEVCIRKTLDILSEQSKDVLNI